MSNSSRSPKPPDPSETAPPAPGSGKVDNGALPSDGTQTVGQPEPQRESAEAQRDKPDTGITPGGAAGGRRV